MGPVEAEILDIGRAGSETRNPLSPSWTARRDLVMSEMLRSEEEGAEFAAIEPTPLGRKHPGSNR
jgi:hypothetical protein